MTSDDILNALLQPVEWTPTIAAYHIGVSVAILNGTEKPQLHTRKAPTELIPRTARMHAEQPMQIWARYPLFHDIAFVITSVKAPGRWSERDAHRVNVYTAMQSFDPHGTDYLIDQYDGPGAFAHILGTPDFLQLAKDDGIRWVPPLTGSPKG